MCSLTIVWFDWLRILENQLLKRGKEVFIHVHVLVSMFPINFIGDNK